MLLPRCKVTFFIGHRLVCTATSESASEFLASLPHCLKGREDEGGSGQQRAEQRPTLGHLTDRFLICPDKPGSVSSSTSSLLTQLILYNYSRQQHCTHTNMYHTTSRIHTYFELLIYPGSVSCFQQHLLHIHTFPLFQTGRSPAAKWELLNGST